MRIIITIAAYPPAYQHGGTATAAHDMARHVAALGHEVCVYTSNVNGSELLDVPLGEPMELDGVTVRYFACDPSPLPWPISKLPYFSKSMGYFRSQGLREAVDRDIGGFDVAHMHSVFCHTNFVLARAARKAGVPYFYQAHGTLQPSHLKFRRFKKMMYIRLYEKRIIRNAAGIIALTEDEIEGYRLLGVKTPAHVIPNGIDTSQLAEDVGNPSQELIARLAGKTVIFFLSRIHPTKGLDLLVPAFCKLASKYPDAVLVVAGPDEFGIVEGFEQMAQREGVGERVIFPGMVTGELKRDLLARADVFALPSYGEGFSMCVLEGMASRTAALITRACHFDEVATEGAGMVVDLSLEQMTGALDEMLSDPNRLAEMGARARQLVIARYQWSKVAQALVDVYTQSVNR